MKNVPGKRTDFHECQWIQQLHSMGLLHAAFRPETEVCADAASQRPGADGKPTYSTYAEGLTQMNVQFQHVISDVNFPNS
jgi:transposase